MGPIVGESVRYSGRNGPEMRQFINGCPERPENETWFMTKSQAGVVDSQAWYYVRESVEVPEGWSGALACVFDPRSEKWLPLRKGDAVVREDGGWAVRAAS